MAKPVVEKRYKLSEQVYLWELIKGMGLTWKHFIFNVKASFRPEPHTIPTCWQYPEDRRPIAPNFRGAHMLMLDEEGREKCVGCGMCAKICPANCITVENAKVPEGEEGKYAGKTYSKTFTIDWLRCIFCGFCEENCPKGALMLGPEYELARYIPEECMADKSMLLANFHKAKQEGKLRPPREPVPVVGAAAKSGEEKPAASADEKGEKPAAKPKAAVKAKPKAAK
ncbi:MAG: NADH-quinone oxidoreductase subunit I [Dissulfuribacterales bacterium]